eukprot:scaffold15240_cov128-Isochrysis_galbana.AAC.7
MPVVRSMVGGPSGPQLVPHIAPVSMARPTRAPALGGGRTKWSGDQKGLDSPGHMEAAGTRYAPARQDNQPDPPGTAKVSYN